MNIGDKQSGRGLNPGYHYVHTAKDSPVINWIMTVLFALFIGGVFSLLFIGCTNPAAPSQPQQLVFQCWNYLTSTWMDCK